MWRCSHGIAPGSILPPQPRPEHHVCALVDLGHERLELAEVVGAVGVADDDDSAARGRESGEIGAAVPALRLVDDSRALFLGDVDRSVGGSVVGDDHLAGKAELLDPLPSGPNGSADSLLLVQARDDDGDLNGVRGGFQGAGDCNKAL